MNVTKSSIKKFIGATLVAVVMCAGVFTVGCGGGGKSINSAEALLEYLNNQPANTPDKPIRVSMKVNEQMIPSIRDVINRANKYVSLNLTGSPLTEIPDEAFATIKRRHSDDTPCQNLVEIVIPNGITRIGDKAFADCENLVSVNIPNSVTEIGRDAFNNTGITNINIPNGVTEIGRGAFASCENLVSVTIPNSVTIIGREAFAHSTSIREITIPSSVVTMGQDVFFGWWTGEQVINVPFPNQDAADAAWGGAAWRIIYYSGQVYPVPILPTINYVGQ